MIQNSALKLFVGLSMMFTISLSLSAQSPDYISYQAIVRNQVNEPIVDSDVQIMFSIRIGNPDGATVYNEVHNAHTNQFGLINLNIGAGSTVDIFSNIDWGAGQYFLNVNVDGNDMGTTQIISVPFALYANRAGNVFSGDYTDLANKPDLGSFITSESDPNFTAHPVSAINSTNIANWNSAFGWGNHTSAGYLTSYSETDPLFIASPAAGITGANISLWNSGSTFDGQYSSLTGAPTSVSYFSNDAGYLTSFIESDPLFAASPAAGITGANISLWNSGSTFDGQYSSLTGAPANVSFFANDAGYLSSYSETDPLFIASPAAGITGANITLWNSGSTFDGQYSSLTGAPANVSFFVNDAGYLSSYTETDPLFAVSPAAGITGAKIANWDMAFGWGNHGAAGYLTSYTETDPLFSAHVSSAITGAKIANWDMAFGWGNHGAAGYLTSYTETDPLFSAHVSSAITGAKIANWDMAFGWGNHGAAGYLTSYTETDPLFIASPAFGITNANITQWNSATSFDGNYSSLTGAPTNLSSFANDIGYLTNETDPLFNASAAKNISTANIANWTSAYGWGNHASAGYLTSTEWIKSGDSLYYTGGNVGIGTNDPRSTLSVKGSTANDTALFEVRNNAGDLIFAVYDNGVRINIDEKLAKGTRGGFAIGGFDRTKGANEEYMRVNGDSIRMYIDNSAVGKGTRGGFAIGGFDKTKGPSSYMTISGRETVTEGYNTFLGYKAGGDGGGTSNTAIGYLSGYNLSTGSKNNIFIGDSAGYNETGFENVYIGRASGKNIFSGYNNVFIGYQTGSTGHSQYNTFIGNESGRLNNGGFANTFLGDRAGRGVTTGWYNTFMGTQSGWKIGDGNYNLMIGTGAGFNSVGADDNTYIGTGAGQNNTSGGQNVFIGKNSGYNTQGSSNIIVGNSWGPQDGSYNILIGHGAGNNKTIMNYQLLVDYRDEVDYNNSFIVGNMQLDLLRFNARTGIRIAPEVGFDLVIAGSAKATSWEVNSDERLKTDIETISNPVEKVMALRGVSFNWKDPALNQSKKHIGFIAQETEGILPEVVNSMGEFMSMDYAPVTALLVEAMKELKKENDALKLKLNRVDDLEAQLEELRNLMENR